MGSFPSPSLRWWPRLACSCVTPISASAVTEPPFRVSSACPIRTPVLLGWSKFAVKNRFVWDEAVPQLDFRVVSSSWVWGPWERWRVRRELPGLAQAHSLGTCEQTPPVGTSAAARHRGLSCLKGWLLSKKPHNAAACIRQISNICVRSFVSTFFPSRSFTGFLETFPFTSCMCESRTS